MPSVFIEPHHDHYEFNALRFLSCVAETVAGEMETDVTEIRGSNAVPENIDNEIGSVNPDLGVGCRTREVKSLHS